ncbi:MAG: rod shape-determining protein RodA [Bacteroidaceae bacterium]|nr:rod shape-determining protein RodA [Bacteroidaceae bacterium]
MADQRDNRVSTFKTVDWFTILLYTALVAFGWFSICGASYDYSSPDFMDFAHRAGKQLVWIGLSFSLGFIILMLDDRIYDMFAYLLYIGMLVLLFVTIFIAPDKKGSHSWLVCGPVSLQPAEFAKFATALALSKFMGTYGFNMKRWRDFLIAVAIVMMPMILIVGQRETGSALVYFAFFFMFYREGMHGSFLFAAIAAVLYFVIGVRFRPDFLAGTPTSVGEFAVLFMVMLFSTIMIWGYCSDERNARKLFMWGGGTILITLLFSIYVIPFDLKWVMIPLCLALIGYLIYRAVSHRLVKYFYVALFAVGSIGFFYSSDYVLNNVMEPHQQIRIKVLLGMEDDPSGAGYNVNQSKIAIGSGGLTGKGFLKGTQTKLKYVPEQDTDFIFCTVGEEQGFVGSAGVLLLFLILIFRLIHLAERQTYTFGRVYGYSVLSIFLFHLFINIGMVLGLTPVIGIPLPFFSYGGSSLWGFSILLFIVLRIDTGRNTFKR